MKARIRGYQCTTHDRNTCTVGIFYTPLDTTLNKLLNLNSYNHMSWERGFVQYVNCFFVVVVFFPSSRSQPTTTPESPIDGAKQRRGHRSGGHRGRGGRAHHFRTDVPGHSEAAPRPHCAEIQGGRNLEGHHLRRVLRPLR